MNRKQFIVSHGGECRNWTWSWAFVNHERREVYWGAWDKSEEGDVQTIFTGEWLRKSAGTGRKSPAIPECNEYINLINDQGYQLFTFRMIHTFADDGKPDGASKIKDFERILRPKRLIETKNGWGAVDDDFFHSDEIGEEASSSYPEGAKKRVTVNSYERNNDARRDCIAKFGLNCSVCDFNFQNFYGDLGESFIQVHHLVPISQIGEEYLINGKQDLRPVCPNCHAMIHKRKVPLTIEALRLIIENELNVAQNT